MVAGAGAVTAAGAASAAGVVVVAAAEEEEEEEEAPAAPGAALVMKRARASAKRVSRPSVTRARRETLRPCTERASGA
jgi:hypothetical protein